LALLFSEIRRKEIMIRKIVQIDQDKCNGCGLCVPSCAEGAIKMINGKAVLSADNLCDGLGACLGECPQDAIRIIEREADEFDEAAVEKHLEETGKAAAGPGHQSPAPAGHGHGGCPGSRAMSFAPPKTAAAEETGSRQSMLGQWPVQLHLVPTNAPYFQDADLLIAADCVPFAYADFHKDFLAGKAVVIGCPKLDDNQFYLQKLTEIFRSSSIKSITVVRMEVPCCGGIVMAARQALAASGRDIPFKEVTVGIRGEIK
jgi:ferredoxin